MADIGLQSGQAQSLEQGLRMSPQLRHSLRLLQAPTLELGQLLQGELEQNPVLEAELPSTSLEEAGYDDDSFGEEPSAEDQWLDDLREEKILRGKTSVHDSGSEQRRQYLFDSQAASETLQQHLLAQLGMIEAEPEVLNSLRALIELLDDEGRLDQELKDLALQMQLPLVDLEEALLILQNLDPAGIGARDLRECLLFQVRRRTHPDPLAVAIVRDHFELFSRNRRQELAHLLRISPARLNQALTWIRSLDPHPARAWSASHNREVRADALVHPDQESASGWRVEIPDDGLPKLRLNPWYKDLVGTTDDKTRAWLKDKLRDGSFMIRALAQRQETLQRVVEEIIRRQPHLPRFGPGALKPMTMAQVAKALKLHETTVSRAVSGKYVATPVGLLELRKLFTTSLGSSESSSAPTLSNSESKSGSDGDGISSESARQQIGELISAETRSKPLSDNKLAQVLGERGIVIARRTVAKYREQLGIPSSNLRRE